MTKRSFLLIAAIMLSCGLSMKATSASKLPASTPAFHAPTGTWHFIYAFGNGAVPGLSWSGDYLYISSGNYIVYSANGYGYLTPSSPVYCSAVANANTYVQVYQSGSSAVSYYDFQEY
jgi:hypothetical protein